MAPVTGRLLGNLAVLFALWTPVALHGYSTVWWFFEVLVLSWGWKADDEHEWGLDEIQVRILTIDEERVVRDTVQHARDCGVDDIKVISETEMDVPNADVYVVPDSFESPATAKGNAHQWALEKVECDTEYVLYLDEDTRITELDGLPDADFVQFTEKPKSMIHSEDIEDRLLRMIPVQLAFLCEIFRTGYQIEMFAFHRLSYPLYAWGGGFAIRRTLERKVTWNDETITEDTNLIWRAARKARHTTAVESVDYQLVNNRFRNQAPKGIIYLIEQRQRWLSGPLTDMHILPLRYYPLYATRMIVWAFSPLFLVVATLAALFPASVPAFEVYVTVSTVLIGTLYFFMFLGLIVYRDEVPLAWWPVCLLLTPLAVVLHGAGALYGVVCPVDEFKQTEKATPPKKN